MTGKSTTLDDRSRNKEQKNTSATLDDQSRNNEQNNNERRTKEQKNKSNPKQAPETAGSIVGFGAVMINKDSSVAIVAENGASFFPDILWG